MIDLSDNSVSWAKHSQIREIAWFIYKIIKFKRLFLIYWLNWHLRAAFFKLKKSDAQKLHHGFEGIFQACKTDIFFHFDTFFAHLCLFIISLIRSKNRGKKFLSSFRLMMLSAQSKSSDYLLHQLSANIQHLAESPLFSCCLFLSFVPKINPRYAIWMKFTQYLESYFLISTSSVSYKKNLPQFGEESFQNGIICISF